MGLISGASARESERLLAESTLTLLLFADAARIDLRVLRTEYALPVRLLGDRPAADHRRRRPCGGGHVRRLTLPEAAVMGVLLAPTDAALGQAVVTDLRLPSRIRQGLNVESGLNDGICVPLLFIALGFAEADSNVTGSSGAARLIGEAIGYGCLGGLIAGCLAAILLTQGRRHGLTAVAAVPLIPVAAAALAYGIATPLGGSGFIAAFVGGLVYGGIVSDEHGTDSVLAEEIGSILDGATFILFGAAILGPTLAVLDWKIALYAVLSLTVIRMVPVWISMAGMHAPTADGRLCRLVRPARAGVHRVRPDRGRGLEAAGDADHPRGDVLHRRAVGVRARPQRAAADRSLRALVPQPSGRRGAADGERGRAAPALAARPPAGNRCTGRHQCTARRGVMESRGDDCG